MCLCVCVNLKLFSSGHCESSEVLNSAVDAVHISQTIITGGQPPTTPVERELHRMGEDRLHKERVKLL